MAICSLPAGDPLTPPNWELARKMRVKLPQFHGTLKPVCFGYLCKGAKIWRWTKLLEVAGAGPSPSIIKLAIKSNNTKSNELNERSWQ